MVRWWGILFAVTMIACLGLFIAAPFLGWWLPEGVSTHSDGVDHLFYVILYITGFFFILTEALLAFFIFKFSGKNVEVGKNPGSGDPFAAKVVTPMRRIIPNEQGLELAWTIVPAVILLYIAFAQVSTWADIKYKARMPKIDEANGPFQIEVSARQFEWRMRYPSYERWQSWKKNPQLARNFATERHMDDVHVANELHVWMNRGSMDPEERYPSFIVHVSSIDVQHALNIPAMRVKQDALPGKIIPVWFRPTRANTQKVDGQWKDGYRFPTGISSKAPVEDPSYVWDIACAELCGRWHYHMIGKVYVHPSQEDFENWLKEAAKLQNQTTR